MAKKPKAGAVVDPPVDEEAPVVEPKPPVKSHKSKAWRVAVGDSTSHLFVEHPEGVYAPLCDPENPVPAVTKRKSEPECEACACHPDAECAVID